MRLKATKTKLEKEVEAWEIPFDCQLNMMQVLIILKENKPCCLEEQVEVKHPTHGYERTGLKLPAKIQLLNQDMEDKEEHAGGEYDIDILKSFKFVAWNFYQSILDT